MCLTPVFSYLEHRLARSDIGQDLTKNHETVFIFMNKREFIEHSDGNIKKGGRVLGMNPRLSCLLLAVVTLFSSSILMQCCQNILYLLVIYFILN